MAEQALLDNEFVLECDGIGKTFETNPVLEEVGMTLTRGRVVALVGENGAGKSTLLNILGGLLEPTTGTLNIGGERITEFDPSVAQANGVQVVTQELSLIPALTVYENIFLGRELTRGKSWFRYIDSKTATERAQQAIDSFGINIRVNQKIEDISLSYAQIVEIVRAVDCQPSILLLDEPTSSLTETETEYLYDIVDKLRAVNTTVVFTTHKMNEIERMADDIVVLRDGLITLTAPASTLTSNEIVNAMVGRKLASQQLELPKFNTQSPVLQVRDYAIRAPASKIEEAPTFNLTAYPGQIIGLAGIAGAGRSAFLKSLYGIHKPQQGEVFIGEETYDNRSPKRSLTRGVIYVPEDRKLSGLVLPMSICRNATLANLEQFSTLGGLIRQGNERSVALDALQNLRTKYTSLNEEVMQLSGGNQQKTLFTRCLVEEEPKLLLLDEPTRGIDVGAKADIYRLIIELANTGIAIVIASSELPELMTLCHQISVFKDGQMKKTFNKNEFEEKSILRVAIGEL